MDITLKQIVEKLPFKFAVGNSDVLKMLMLKNDNEFLRFSGKDQFDKKVKAKYPEIDVNDLSEDYLFVLKKSHRVLWLCQWYKEHGDLLLEFRFQESMDENANIIGSEYKVLDGTVRHVKDKFWNKYFPPNFSYDSSYIRHLSPRLSNETPIPKDLPKSIFECNLDAILIF